MHPLFCGGFITYFDGDQMVVHRPLSLKAQASTFILKFTYKSSISSYNRSDFAWNHIILLYSIYQQWPKITKVFMIIKSPLWLWLNKNHKNHKKIESKIQKSTWPYCGHTQFHMQSLAVWLGLPHHISSPFDSLCKCPRYDATSEHQDSCSQGVQLNDNNTCTECPCIIQDSLFTHTNLYFPSKFAMCHAPLRYDPTRIPCGTYSLAQLKMK